MFIDDVVGYRDIIPVKHHRSYIIKCHDVANKETTLGYTKLVNYAVDLYDDQEGENEFDE
jgi:hypothetical protein